MQNAKNALLVIDVQKDYFPQGRFPLENIEAAAARVVEKIRTAQQQNWLVVGVRHESGQDAPIFAQGSSGAELHPQVAEALGDAPMVVKRHADSFLDTDLEKLLSDAGITDLYLAGMMTQNCVAFTAFSARQRQLRVHILADCCAAPSLMIHRFALAGLGDCFDVITG